MFVVRVAFLKRQCFIFKHCEISKKQKKSYLFSISYAMPPGVLLFNEISVDMCTIRLLYRHRNDIKPHEKLRLQFACYAYSNLRYLSHTRKKRDIFSSEITNTHFYRG